MRRNALVFWPLLCLCAACAASEPMIPPHLKGKQLGTPTAFPEKYREAVVAAAGAVKAPHEFYVEIEEKPAEHSVVLHLWHATAFLPENRGMMGNPGGQCRDIVYDTRARKVVKVLFWQ